MRARLRGHVSIWPLRFWGMRGALAPVLLLFVEGISIQTIPLHDLHDQDLVNHLLEGVAGMTREGHLEACVQTLLEEVHLLLLGVCITRSVPHHASEAVGVLLDLLGTFGNVVELFHFGIHHALGYVVLMEGFGELLP